MASTVVRSALLLLAVGIACGKSERSGARGDTGDAGEGANAGTGANSGRAGDEGTDTGGSAGNEGTDTGGLASGGDTHTGGSAGTSAGGSAGVNDAGAGAGGETGGAPTRPTLPQQPTPGSIRCGSQMCDAQSQLCCSGMAGSGVGGSGMAGSGVGGSEMAGSGAGGSGMSGSSTSTGFESCSATFCPYRRECDEPSDCVGTEVCCFHVVASPPSVLASSCEEPEQCAFDGYWLGCGSHDDCDAAGAPDCVAQDCKGQTIQTCGPISRTACNF
jgi:hypothetical protein